MISIIICSRTANLDDALAQNIDTTIGIQHQIITIDNSQGQYSICQAYNLGIKQSKYDILCFMHDDIQYHTQNWGTKLADHFANNQVDAVGIAGTPYCAYMPGPWWGNGILYRHLLQGTGNDKEPVLISSNESSKRQPAIILDGVWFCVKRPLFDKVSFDEETFNGFHFYDADISMQLHAAGAKLWCINDVLISHHSMGNVNKAWIDNARIFHNKWKNALPATGLQLSTAEKGKLEYKTLNSFILACAPNNYSNRQIYAMALRYLFSFKQGYLFYKTPGYLVKFLYKYLFKKGAPFYALS